MRDFFRKNTTRSEKMRLMVTSNGRIVPEKTRRQGNVGEEIRRKAIGMAAAFIIIILICVMRVSAADSQTGSAITRKGVSYESLEQETLSGIRGMLNEQGFLNAGVSLTHTENAYGERTYTIRIHHRRLEKLSEERRASLLEDIEGWCFGDAASSFEIVLS